ncbi:MAG: hypothetical protein DBX55_00850 [Verrucomicrobia bacterium]|nr:MAG: hypothetical protein DBX55_00850 [Verrucomicrobiota bacterium]
MHAGASFAKLPFRKALKNVEKNLKNFSCAFRRIQRFGKSGAEKSAQRANVAAHSEEGVQSPRQNVCEAKARAAQKCALKRAQWRTVRTGRERGQTKNCALNSA